MTDCWAAYLTLANHGFNHWAVNHSRAFVDPLTGAHTETIEGLWALVKNKFKNMRGCPSKYIQDYLDEFTFRRTFKNSPITLMGELMITIATYWNQIDNLNNDEFETYANIVRGMENDDCD